MKTTPWIDRPLFPSGSICTYRARAGTTGEFISDRIAFIEKTPRVRIRPYTISDDYLNWCEGPKGSGPDDATSKLWCDKMLELLGYDVVNQSSDNLKKLIIEGNTLVRASRHYMEVTDTMLEHSENGDIPQDVMESVSEAHGSLNRCIHYWNKRVMKILQENQEVTNQ